MLALCYHNGALGHTVGALMDCCTKEGTQDFPSFVPGMHLHNHISNSKFYKVCHPWIDIPKEKQHNNTVISASSYSTFGRLLIVLMGLKKWNKSVPMENAPVLLRQDGDTVQEQIEVLSNTLFDKVSADIGWYLDVDHVLDITNFWNDSNCVSEFLINCGLHPVDYKVKSFCQLVANSNQKYFDIIENCVKISNDILDGKVYDTGLDFFESAMCHMLLMKSLGKRFYEQPQRLKCFPASTLDYIKIFKD
jgi:hypothetical protein